MNGKTARILSYITWIGWLVVFFSADKDNDPGLKQHLNQALICNIAAIIPIGITQVAASIFAIWGLIKAIQEDDEPLPLFGGLTIIK